MPRKKIDDPVVETAQEPDQVVDAPEADAPEEALNFENCQYVRSPNGRVVAAHDWHRRMGASRGFVPVELPE